MQFLSKSTAYIHFSSNFGTKIFHLLSSHCGMWKFTCNPWEKQFGRKLQSPPYHPQTAKVLLRSNVNRKESFMFLKPQGLFSPDDWWPSDVHPSKQDSLSLHNSNSCGLFGQVCNVLTMSGYQRLSYCRFDVLLLYQFSATSRFNVLNTVTMVSENSARENKNNYNVKANIVWKSKLWC